MTAWGEPASCSCARGTSGCGIRTATTRWANSNAGYDIVKGLGEAWLNHHQRRTYDRIALIPSGPCPPDVYNLWRGWGVEPKAGSWSTIEAHLREVDLLRPRRPLRLADRLAGLLRPAPRPAGRGRRCPPRPQGHRQGHGRPDADADVPAITPCTSPTPSTWSGTSMPTWSTRCSCSSTRHSGPVTSRERERSRR